MGIIEKQATRNVIYSYLGAGLGFITLMWLPHLLTTDENGLIRILISITALIAQFSNLGFTSVTIRFFPYFRNKEMGHHGFLFYAIFVSLIGFILCFIVFYIFKAEIIANNIEKSKLFVDYINYLMPLTFFTVFFNIFDAYLRASFSSVVGSITKEFIQRILILILLAVFFFQLITFPVFIFFYIVATCLPTLMLLVFIIRMDEWHVKPVRGFLTKALRNEMLALSFFSIISGLSGAIVLNIDSIMVNSMLGLSLTGVYGIASQFGSMIVIPARSLYRITSSVVAESFKKEDISGIKSLYIKSCNNQLAIGALLFIGIWANIDNIMRLLPHDFAQGRSVILFISAGYLVEMATGINQVIISNSKYFRVEAYFVFVTVGVVVIANYIFIPIYGIAGSALATAVTITFANIIRFVFLYIKFGMQPYNINTLKLLSIAMLCYLSVYFIPLLQNKYIDIAIRSSIISGLFFILILLTEATPELNSKIRKNLKRFGLSK
jgi:O-antigen/teichoic acid export membrane protein